MSANETRTDRYSDAETQIYLTAVTMIGEDTEAESMRAWSTLPHNPCALNWLRQAPILAQLISTAKESAPTRTGSYDFEIHMIPVERM